MAEEINIEDMAVFCKKKGFVYPNSEIYGGVAGIFDYGPLGADLKNNIKHSWWKAHVQDRDDIVGIDGAIITSPKVWEASGHVDSFEDVLVGCRKCGEKFRADVLVEEATGEPSDGLKPKELDKKIKDNKIKCPKCKSELAKAKPQNLMFTTFVGPDTKEPSYLRPETAQVIFADFKQVTETTRVKLPFGIAQIGKAFRNEISPRNFLFRVREFEQMEIEYFIHPASYDDCPFIKEVEKVKLNIYDSEMQKKKKKAKSMTVKDALANKVFASPWHAYWLATELKWFTDLGANPGNFRVRQHLPDEKAHYSKDCWDLEYKFPFGYKELQGIADRGDFDLQQHIKHSKKDLSLFDEETKEKVVPHVVAEPSLGIVRTFLVFMFDAYNDDKKRGNIVLKLHPKLAPIKAAVFPLVNKLNKEAEKVYKKIKKCYPSMYDKSGSVGRRYARADEIGVPYCITVDFDYKKDKSVTIRDRDTTKQIRVKEDELCNTLFLLLTGQVKFGKAGKPL